MYKERVQNLMSTISKKNEGQPGARDFVFSAIERSLVSFSNYVSAVYAMETQMTVQRHRIDDPKEWQEFVTGLDRSRRMSHDAAIAGVSMLNRICETSGLEKVYDGPNDRDCIGDFCGAIVNEYFEGRSRGRVIEEKEMKQVFAQEIEVIDRGE